jgi:hypothetical protein
MDDERVRTFETRLWTGGEQVYRASVSPECLMVLPAPPFVMSGMEAIEAVSGTPRWTDVKMDDLRISRPQEGLIVLAYQVTASRGDQVYQAICSSTYQRLGPEDWNVVQHQQSLKPSASAMGSEIE